jgi:predicted NUDIX family NTP pyrophosphohydrolase
MPERSAGILLYRRGSAELEIFLVHPGGPFWARKDKDAWSIPKGRYEEGEEPLAAARREFREETGQEAEGSCVRLGEFRQPGGKRVTAYALEGDCDETAIRSNLFSLEWPPRSGKKQEFPEVDRAAWFTADQAEEKLHKGLKPLVAALRAKLSVKDGT